MKLHRVTITGADDNTKPDLMYDLSVSYPFVEWGILVSKKHVGRPRFPGMEWVGRLVRTRPFGDKMSLSLHVCGQWARDLLAGNVKDLIETCPGLGTGAFKRLQINMPDEPQAFDPKKAIEARWIGLRSVTSSSRPASPTMRWNGCAAQPAPFIRGTGFCRSTIAAAAQASSQRNGQFCAVVKSKSKMR